MSPISTNTIGTGFNTGASPLAGLNLSLPTQTPTPNAPISPFTGGQASTNNQYNFSSFLAGNTPAQTAPIASTSSFQDQVNANIARAKSYSDMNIPSSPITPQNFNIPQKDVLPSTSLNTSGTVQSLQDKRNQMQQDMTTGKNPSLVPTDTNLQTLAGNIYNTAQYSPEEQALLQKVADDKQRILTEQLAQRRNIQSLYNNGTLSKSQAQEYSSEAQRRSDAQLADLATTQNADTLRLQVLGQIRGNQLDAYKTQAGFYTPNAVAPGSSLITPLGQVVGQSQGGSPQAILSYAQDLINNDRSQGTLRTNSDGSIDTNYYQQTAQRYFGGQGNIGQPTSNGIQTNGLDQIAQALVNGTLSPSNIPAGLNQTEVYTRANNLSMQTTGQPFDFNKAQANYNATNAGLNLNATTYRTLADAQATAVTHLNEALGYAEKLSSGAFGLGDTPYLNSGKLMALRTLGNSVVGQYDSALAIARGEIAKVLAGGNAPTDNDAKEADKILPNNLGYAQLKAKIDTINSLMKEKIKQYSNTSNVPQYGQNQAQDYSQSPAIVETKAGVINTGW